MVNPVAVSALFVPGDRPERFAKAAAAGAECIIIDLEDAVAPDAKLAARNILCRPQLLPAGSTIFVRINARGTAWHDEDLSCVAGLPIAGVVLPKSESEAEVLAVSAAIGGRPVVALIETARGLAEARRIAAATPGLRLAFGSIDYSVDLGCAHTRDALLAARSELVLASTLARLQAPFDGVTMSIDDAALVEDDARYAATLGFGGKLCIHPHQLVAIRKGFAPTKAEVARAHRILAAASEGAVSVDGAMVDAPVRLRAQAILARASA